MIAIAVPGCSWRLRPVTIRVCATCWWRFFFQPSPTITLRCLRQQSSSFLDYLCDCLFVQHPLWKLPYGLDLLTILHEHDYGVLFIGIGPTEQSLNRAARRTDEEIIQCEFLRLLGNRVGRWLIKHEQEAVGSLAGGKDILQLGRQFKRGVIQRTRSDFDAHFP